MVVQFATLQPPSVISEVVLILSVVTSCVFARYCHAIAYVSVAVSLGIRLLSKIAVTICPTSLVPIISATLSVSSIMVLVLEVSSVPFTEMVTLKNCPSYASSIL